MVPSAIWTVLIPELRSNVTALRIGFCAGGWAAEPVGCGAGAVFSSARGVSPSLAFCPSPTSEAGRLLAALSSSSMVGQQMAVSFGIKLDDSLVNGVVEVIRAGEGLMSEVMPLQVAPDPFNIVQLRGVFRTPLARSQGVTPARAARLALLVWIGPLSRTSTTGLSITPSLGP